MTLNAATGAGLFASELVRTLFTTWIAAKGDATRAQMAGISEKAAADLETLLGLNDELMKAMLDDLAR
jgi:hypothetical protein